MARRKFQRGSVFLNKTKTMWFGSYSNYQIGTDGVERRVQKQITISPDRSAPTGPFFHTARSVSLRKAVNWHTRSIRTACDALSATPGPGILAKPEKPAARRVQHSNRRYLSRSRENAILGQKLI